jgi:capsular polysaccharide biosynthesis protein
MSRQGINLRTCIWVVRRYKILVSIFVGLGILGGCAYVMLYPPVLTSEVVIVVPGAASASTTTPTDNTTTMSTDVVVATSDPVLSQALPQISPSLSLQQLRGEVQAVNLTSTLIQVTGISRSKSGAQSIANAVANSFVAYITSPNSPLSHQTARILEAASPAKGASIPGRLVTYGLIGAIGGFLLGLVIGLARNSGDRTLRQRDDIASSIGVPVLAAVRARRPGNAVGWAQLFEDYQPGAVEAWHLHRLLDRVAAREDIGNNGASHCASVAVLSLSSDPGALALGPQIASFAASLGIRTALVVGPQQDDSVVATLRTACSVSPSESRMRSRPLLVVAQNGSRLDNLPVDTSLVVVVVVVDSGRPKMPDTVPTVSTLLAVTSGAATAEQLARAATTAAADGRDVIGFVVADPDPVDQTTGLVPQLGRPAHRRLPTRLTGMPMEAKR